MNKHEMPVKWEAKKVSPKKKLVKFLQKRARLSVDGNYTVGIMKKFVREDIASETKMMKRGASTEALVDAGKYPKWADTSMSIGDSAERKARELNEIESLLIAYGTDDDENAIDFMHRLQKEE